MLLGLLIDLGLMSKWIGPHVSAAGGVYNAPRNAREIGATAIGMFTKNQMQWKARQYTDELIQRFAREMEAGGFKAAQVLPHSAYLINLGSPNHDTRRKSLEAITDELSRCEQLGLRYLNFHPGSSKGEIDHSECMRLIADGMKHALANTESAFLVLENTAGTGSTKGRSVEELAEIMGLLPSTDRVGICIDTCHAFAAGYPVHTPEGWDLLLRDIERVVGLKHLVGLHLNDSQHPLGSNKDRHACIGDGYLGTEGFVHIVRDARTNEMPMILETPKPERWKFEVGLLHAIAAGQSPEEAANSATEQESASE